MLSSFTEQSKLNETIWNFPANFNKTIKVGESLQLRDGTYSLGIIFRRDGSFSRTSQIRYYEKDSYKRKPDNLKGTWNINVIGSHVHLNMEFGKKSKIKFDVLKLDDYLLKIKVLEKS